ncbi:MAG TPA: MFS transporter [Thermoleophilaceae bacterium]|nr:MFS transporter [Thermoleophilaceae bacterium]
MSERTVDEQAAVEERERPRENPSPEFLHRNKWRIFGVMMIGWAMSLLDVSIVNITIPELQTELSTDIGTVTWVVNAYNIVFAVLLVSMGRLADQFGRKRFFIIGLTVFTIGSGLCAAAWSVEWLIGFRVIQGIGAGILAPLGFAITVLVFPPHQRGRGLALIAVVALISSAAGPVIGGGIVEVLSWHWIFLINIPFGILGVVLCLRWWPETWDLSAGREVDVRGMALLGGAVFFLTVALVEANPFGGDLPLWLSLMQGAILLGVLFVWWERKAPNPLITPSLIANRQFRSANLGMLFFGAGAIGTLLLLSLVFVNLWGYSQIEAGLAIAPMALMGLVVWPFVGRAADKRAPGELAKPGLIAMALGMLIVSFLPSTADSALSYLRILPGLLLIGAGMGICFPALNVGAMGAVAGPEVGLASGILNTARQLGAAIGVAILIATFGGALHAHMSWFADDEIEDIVDEWEIPKAEAGVVIQSTLHDYTGGTSDRFEPKPGFDEEIIRETAGSAREGFAWALRQAALLVLTALPLMGALKRTPAQAQAEFMERMKAQQAAGGGAPPSGAPPPDGNGGDQPDGDGAPPDGAPPDGDGAPARPAARPGSGPEPRPA